MRIRGFGLGLAILGSCWSAATAQQFAGVEARKDYTELSRLIHKMVGGQFPKVFEQDEGWGQTIPVPAKLRLQGLRTRLLVDGKEVLPHGLWRKVQARLDDPQRDLAIRVRSLQPQPDGSYRLQLDVDAALHHDQPLLRVADGLAVRVDALLPVDHLGVGVLDAVVDEDAAAPVVAAANDLGVDGAGILETLTVERAERMFDIFANRVFGSLDSKEVFLGVGAIGF